MNDFEITAYKTLAASVFKTAISDLRSKRTRAAALRFLTSPSASAARNFWLAWIGIEDVGFQAMLGKKAFRGQRNVVRLVADVDSLQKRRLLK